MASKGGGERDIIRGADLQECRLRGLPLLGVRVCDPSTEPLSLLVLQLGEEGSTKDTDKLTTKNIVKGSARQGGWKIRREKLTLVSGTKL